MRNLKITIIYILLVGIFSSCKDEMKFDQIGWQQKGDINSFPNREKMLEDLLINHPLKGITYQKLVELLGEPEINYNSESNEIYYSIITEYGNDIDPISETKLEIELKRDSTVSGVKILKFKK